MSREEWIEPMAKVSYSFKLLREFVAFAREYRAYWMVPLVIFLGLAAVVMVGGQSAAPLLYALF